MKISKQLEGIALNKSAFIKHRLEMKAKVEELMFNSIRKDKGENISEILEPFDNRFDKYFAQVVRECNTSLILHDPSKDEYYMINSERECINLSQLTERYVRLPLSEWLARYGVHFFDIDVDLPQEVSWGFNQSEDVFNMVAMIFMQGIEIAEKNGNTGILAYDFLYQSSAQGNYIPLESFELSEPTNEINELHLIMSRLNDILLKYPISLYGNPFNAELIIDFGTGDNMDFLKSYNGFKTSHNATPFETMSMWEIGMNEYLIDLLNEGIQQD